MWDNNNVQQLQFNEITLENKGNFLSKCKLHNHKKVKNFQILHHKTKSQRNKPYLLNNHSDSNRKNQAMEQQESVLSQRSQMSSSTFI